MNNLDDDTPSGATHIIKMCEIWGQHYNVFWVCKAQIGSGFGSWPYTADLVKGGGVLECSENVVLVDDTLSHIGIVESYPHRDDESCEVLLLDKKGWIGGEGPDFDTSDMKLKADLVKVKKVTEELNASIGGPREAALRTYSIATPIRELDPRDNKVISLDYFLKDQDVIKVLVNSGFHLGPDFAACDVAHMYFSPDRQTYPPEIHQYGFTDFII